MNDKLNKMELALGKAKKQRDSMIGFCHKQAEEFKVYASSFGGRGVGVDRGGNRGGENRGGENRGGENRGGENRIVK